MVALRGLGLVAAAVAVGVVLLGTVPTPRRVATVAVHKAERHKTLTTVAPKARSRHSSKPRRSPSPTTVNSLPASRVTVLVANGTGVGLGATHLDQALRSAGYKTLGPMNTTRPESAPAVYFASGYDQAAAALAQRLRLPPSSVTPLPASVPVTSYRGADVVIIEGTTLAHEYSTTSTLPPQPGRAAS
jgi:hypothetical protein